MRDLSDNIFSGSTPKSGGDDYTEDGGIAFIRSGDFTADNEISIDELIYITEETHNKKLKSSKLKYGDVLIAIVGATIGKVGVFLEKYEANINQAICAVRLKEEIEPLFAHLIFQTSFGQIQLDRIKRPVARANINLDEISSILIPVIPKEKQIEITQFFKSKIHEKSIRLQNAKKIIEKVDEIIAQKIGFKFPKVDEKKTFGIKVSTFENRLDPNFYLPNFKALLDNIRKTKNAPLMDLVEFSKETWNQNDGFENEFPYIEISQIDLSSGKINDVSYVSVAEAPSRAKMVVRINDIIVSTTRPHRGAISYIDKTKDGFIASTGFAILRNLKTNEISKEYLFYILRTQICLQQMLQRSSGGSYPAITVEELKNIYIPIPDKDIQQEIVNDIKAFILQAEQLKEEAKAEFERAKHEIEAIILNVGN